MTQLFNNIIVWIIFYYEYQFLGIKKKKSFLYLSLGKIDPFIIEIHNYIKIQNYKIFQIISYLINFVFK